jgi:predicted nucleic acid-binding Zn ribbon protein
MFRDFKCARKGCRGKLIDAYVDVLDPWPVCPVCGGEMQDVSWKTAKVAIKGKGYTKKGIR